MCVLCMNFVRNKNYLQQSEIENPNSKRKTTKKKQNISKNKYIANRNIVELRLSREKE